MINIEMLELMCPNCNGDGYIINPDWEEYRYKKKQIELETKKKYEDYNYPFVYEQIQKALQEADLREPKGAKEYICPECEGRGVILSEEGKILIDFLKKYL
jgi:Ribonuclease G/E